VTWDALSAPDNGDSDVISYELVWDEGSLGATWTSLVGLVTRSTDLEYTVGTGITTGDTYQFKLRAENIYGWGPYSTAVSIIASDIPS